MQGIKERAQVDNLFKELTIQPLLNEDTNVVMLTGNELANLLLKISSDISKDVPLDKLLESTVALIGQTGIAERVLLFQLNENGTKAYLTNYWGSSYIPSLNPIGFQIDLRDPPFKLFPLSKSPTIQIGNFEKYLSLPNYMFKNKYKAFFLKLVSKSILLTLGSSEKVKILLNLQFSTREVVWSNEIEKVLQSIVDQLAIAVGKYTDQRNKEKLQKSVTELQKRALIEHDELLRRFASDVHDLPCSFIPKLKVAIKDRNYELCEKLVDEINSSLRQLINEYVVPDMNLLGFVSNVYQFVNGFKKGFGGNVIVEVPDDEIDVSMKNASELFKVIKEWLCNIEKHSNATEVLFTLKKLNELYFAIIISDNGKGFEANDSKTMGYGIPNIKRRLRDIGAKFEIQSKTNQGSILKIQALIK